MKFLAGFVGAIVGAVMGAITVNLVCADMNDDLGFGMVELGIPALVVGAICGMLLGVWVVRYLGQGSLTPLARRIRGGVLSVAFAVLFALAWGMVRAADAKTGPPADQVFLDDFPRHEATLYQIVQMAQQDTRILKSPGTPIPSGRLTQYYQLLLKAQTTGNFFRSDKADEVEFDYYRSGGLVSSSETDEGYAYLTKPPVHLVNNLDDYQFNEHDDDQKAFRHIHGNWYLFREYEPN